MVQRRASEFRSRYRDVCAVLLIVFSASLLAAQDQQPAPPPPPPQPQFFAGTITEISSEEVTVSRKLFGHPQEEHTFVITPQTKSSKPLKVNSRVTVRYVSMPEGDLALQIQLRAQPKTVKPE